MFYFKNIQSSTNIPKNSKLLKCCVFIFKSQKAIERTLCRKSTAADCTVHCESKSTSKPYCKQTSQQSYSTVPFWFDYILQHVLFITLYLLFYFFYVPVKHFYQYWQTNFVHKGNKMKTCFWMLQHKIPKTQIDFKETLEEMGNTD